MHSLKSIYKRGMRRIRAGRQGVYSYFDEQLVISKYIRELKLNKKFCVDIAAGDGVTMSNTYFLFRDGWGGLAVEYDARKFSRLARTYRDFPEVHLAKCKVTPENIVALLKANQLPKDFSFLNLDIDSYDYFVLEQLLGEFRPALISAEINECIPPPVRFSVKWQEDFVWPGGHLYGQSLSQLCSLCPRFGYSLVDLHYNNAFLVPSEINRFPALTPEEAYAKGYRGLPDRKELLPWNADMEELLELNPDQAVDFINRHFSSHKGKFICSL